jgi:hypothetical protein
MTIEENDGHALSLVLERQELEAEYEEKEAGLTEIEKEAVVRFERLERKAREGVREVRKGVGGERDGGMSERR